MKNAIVLAVLLVGLPGRAGKGDQSPPGSSLERALSSLARRYADVAELVDAHGSGPCGGDSVEVRVLSSAWLSEPAWTRAAASVVATLTGDGELH